MEVIAHRKLASAPSMNSSVLDPKFFNIPAARKIFAKSRSLPLKVNSGTRLGLHGNVNCVSRLSVVVVSVEELNLRICTLFAGCNAHILCIDDVRVAPRIIDFCKKEKVLKSTKRTRF